LVRNLSKYQILFYDVDGVLHPGDSETLSRQYILVDYLLSNSNVRLVMSSNWREMMDYDFFSNTFDPIIVNRTVGFTPVLPSCSHRRGKEVLVFIKQFHIKRFLVIDDTKNLFTHDFVGLAHTDRHVGLTLETLKTNFITLSE
jgi:hypothetical protein